MLLAALSVALLAAAPSPTVKPPPPVTPVDEAPTPPATPAAAPTSSEEATSDSSRRRPLRIAVYAFESAGLDERVVRITEASVLEELRKLQRVSVLSLDEVKALLDLEAEKQLAGCSESSCLSEIAEALGADALVTGGITQVGDTVSIAWKRIDPNAAAVVQTFTRQLTAAGAAG